MKEVLLKGEAITKEYNKIPVLQGINVEIYQGDFTVIMGSSGAGKSTLWTNKGSLPENMEQIRSERRDRRATV